MKNLTKTRLASFLNGIEKREHKNHNNCDEELSNEYSEGVFEVISKIRREFGISAPDPESLKPPVAKGEVGEWEHYIHHKNPLDNDLYFELQVYDHLKGKVGEFYGAGWWAPSFYDLKEEIAKMIKRSGISADQIELQQRGINQINGHPYGVIIIKN